jgi:hypothetical protein
MITTRHYSPCSTALLFTMMALGMTAPGWAATTKEVALATSQEALSFCSSGATTAKEDYFAGPGGAVQFAYPFCIQALLTVSKVRNAIVVSGANVSECRLAASKAATKFCNSGAMGTYDVDYIAGHVGETISGPGYGCAISVVGRSTTIGTALCQ